MTLLLWHRATVAKRFNSQYRLGPSHLLDTCRTAASLALVSLVIWQRLVYQCAKHIQYCLWIFNLQISFHWSLAELLFSLQFDRERNLSQRLKFVWDKTKWCWWIEWRLMTDWQSLWLCSPLIAFNTHWLKGPKSHLPFIILSFLAKRSQECFFSSFP